jgi:hypothetical protein
MQEMLVFGSGLAGILARDVIIQSFLVVLYVRKRDFMKPVMASVLTKNNKNGQVLELVAKP